MDFYNFLEFCQMGTGNAITVNSWAYFLFFLKALNRWQLLCWLVRRYFNEDMVLELDWGQFVCTTVCITDRHYCRMNPLTGLSICKVSYVKPLQWITISNKKTKRCGQFDLIRLVCIKYESFLSTRMHSSRMRTGRSLTVCCSLLPGGSAPRRGGLSAGGGCLLPGGAWSGGCLLGGWCLVWRGGYPSMHWGRHPSSPVDRHTLVKTLPWPNFVAAGN